MYRNRSLPASERAQSVDGSGAAEQNRDALVSSIESVDKEAILRLANDLPRSKRDAFLDSNAGLHAVLVALENCDDESVTALCTMLLAYAQDGKTSVRTRHARRLVQGDTLSSASRALRDRVAASPYAAATDALVDLVMVVAMKDAKTQFKLRVGGLVTALCHSVVEGKPPPSERLLALLAKSLRSPRNAQFAARVKDFPRSVLQRATEARVTATMTRHLEILYLICKNKRTRTQLQSASAVRSLVQLLERLASQLADPSSQSIEAALIVVGLLKLFANSRKGKEEVLGAGMVAACERCLQALERRGANTMAAERHALQLQDSLCSLCIRCVPAERFPLAGRANPLTFALPQQHQQDKRTRAKTSEGGVQRRATTSYARAEGGPSSDEDRDDADDDEMVEELGEESGGSGASDGEVDEREAPLTSGPGAKNEGIREQSDMPKLSLYSQFFVERRKAVERTTSLDNNSSSMSLRRKGSGNLATLPTSHTQAILNHARTTRSLCPWVKVAYPELIGPDRELPLQPLVFSTNSMRQVAARATRRAAEAERQSTTSNATAKAPPSATFKPKVVFDLDALINKDKKRTEPTTNPNISNDDRTRLGKINDRYDHLLFESRFEGGNLRAAIQSEKNHYELVLQPDINQARDHFQWFYFEVSNVESNVDYTFEIINCLKPSSMFTHGMQPVAFSVGEAAAGRPGWVRVGHSVCYYRNQYVVDASGSNDIKGHRKDRFFSLRFTCALRHRADVCYFAYHYPYTSSFLQATLECWTSRSRLAHGVVARTDVIGQSLGGNPLTLVTVTGEGSLTDISGRDTVVFSARVHPGESNASWIMHGILEYLLTSDDNDAISARNTIVFKLLPMLNPDGVLAGNHRCSLAGHDLNRVWDSPSRTLHPEIFHSKAIVQAATAESGPPVLVVDIHGHSRRSNCFLYGNNPDQSWLPTDVLTSPSLDFIDLAELLESRSPAFAPRHCRWSIQRSKEGSARVALWRQLALRRVYTLECTYAGFEQGPYKGYQIGISELKEIGRNLVQAALKLSRNQSERK